MNRILALALVALALPATTSEAHAWDFVMAPRVTIRTLSTRPTVVARPVAVRVGTATVATQPSATQNNTQPAPSTAGSLRCSATRNGVESRATVELIQNGRTIASAACGLGALPLSAIPGAYVARISLADTFDGTHRDVPVQVVAGQVRGLTVEVPTALLEVRAEVAGRLVFGRAIVRRSGNVVGSLGSGVVATLTPGSYDIEVVQGSQRRLLQGIRLAPGQRRALRVAF